jgi:hypothetical protein
MTSNAEKTHCIHGHPFDEANTRWTSRGQRDCRACGRARELRLAADPAYRQHKRNLDRERQLDPARRARKTAQERESYRARSLARSLGAEERRALPAATHCARGHLASVENTRVQKDGRRVCRVCAREGMRRYAASSKGRAAIMASRERLRAARPWRTPKTHCPHGHSLDDAYVSKGRRRCRVCQRDAYRLKWPTGKPRKPLQTRCKHGHSLSDAYVCNGKRTCRSCRVEAYRRSHPLPAALA